MLRQLKKRAHTLLPVEESLPQSPEWPQASVLLALSDHPEDPEVILTRRASHLSTHSGEVSFPGGKLESQDSSLCATALRESHEEIGLAPASVEVIGQLPPVMSRWKLEVTPFVGIVPQGVSLTPNPGEIESIFHVPLSFFLADKRIRTDRFDREHVDFWAPAYDYEGYTIWGFTAGILVAFVNQIYDAGISVDSSDAPQRIFT